MSATPPASPCINVCQMDAPTGWCAGCLRTLDEIAGWSRMGDAAKAEVLALLPAREVHWQTLGRPVSPQRRRARP